MITVTVPEIVVNVALLTAVFCAVFSIALRVGQPWIDAAREHREWFQ